MVHAFCNANNFTQMVDQITRVQYNSIAKKPLTSCIDHIYNNDRLRISKAQVISFGSSDHDAVSFIRLSKEPSAPARTIRKRNYKNFNAELFVQDIAKVNFSSVYACLDVDDAAVLLTNLIVSVLNVHAPWIVFQQRKHFQPWITTETSNLMKKRDKLKQEAKAMTLFDGVVGF